MNVRASRHRHACFCLKGTGLATVAEPSTPARPGSLLLKALPPPHSELIRGRFPSQPRHASRTAWVGGGGGGWVKTLLGSFVR